MSNWLDEAKASRKAYNEKTTRLANEKREQETMKSSLNKFKAGVHSEDQHDAVMRNLYGSYKQYISQSIENSKDLSDAEKTYLIQYYGIGNNDILHKNSSLGQVSEPYQKLVGNANSGAGNAFTVYNDNDVNAWSKTATDVGKRAYQYVSTEGYKAPDENLIKEIDKLLASSNDVAQYIRANKGKYQDYESAYNGYVDTVNYLKSLKSAVTQSNSYFAGFESKAQYEYQKKHMDEVNELVSVADPESESYDPNLGKYVEIGKEYYQSTHTKTPASPAINFDQKGYSSSNAEKMSQYRKQLYSFEYNNMTEEERLIYHYYLGKAVEESGGGEVNEETAEKYVKLITGAINARHGQKMAEEFKNDKLAQLMFSAYAGIENWSTGIANNFNNSDGYIAPTATAVASQQVREDMHNDGTGWGVSYDIINMLSNMAPSIALSYAPIVGKFLGAASIGLSASGNAYAAALNKGYSQSQARTYSVLVGASEAGLQYLMGGLSKLGGKYSLSSVISKIDNVFARLALSGAAEGIEEGVQAYLDPWFESIVTGVDFEAPNAEDVLYNSLIAFLSTGILEGSAVTGTISDNINAKNLYGSTQEDMQALVNEGLEMPQDSKAYQLAMKYQQQLKNNGKLSGAQLNKLVNANENAIISEDKVKIKDAIQARLYELGEIKNATEIADAIVKQITGEKLSAADKTFLKESKYAARIVNELSAENIGTGEYSNSWAERINTERINSDVYGASVQDDSAQGVDGVENERYNNVTNANENDGGNINGSEDTELLERREVSTAGRSRNALRQQGENSEAVRGPMGDVSEAKGYNDIVSEGGGSAWLSSGNLNASQEMGSGLTESFLRTLREKRPLGVDAKGRIVSKRNQERLGETVFKAEDGSIMVLYHWTPKKFDEFKYGDGAFHMGTLTAALSIKSKAQRKTKGYLKEVYVISKHPFIVEDNGGFGAYNIARQMLEKKILDKDTFEKICSMNGFFSDKYDAEANVFVRQYLKDLGFDSYLYWNRNENTGAWSVGVFDADQIITVAENGVLKEGAGVSEEVNDASTESSEDVNSDSQADDSAPTVITELSAADKKKDAFQKATESVTGYKELTEDQKELKRIGSQFGAKVEFDNLDKWRTDPETGERFLFSPEGQFDPDTNTITLNSNAKEWHSPVKYILKHELTHSFEVDPESYNLFAKDILNSQEFEKYVKTKKSSVTGKNFENAEQWKEDIISRYKKQGIDYGADAELRATQEMVANFVGDCLFGGRNQITEKLLNAMKPQQQKTFIQKIKDFIAKVKEVFKGKPELTEIERLEKAFLDTAKRVAEYNEKQNNTQQKTTTENGSGVVYSSEMNNRYADYDKPITIDDVRTLRSIGQKSINDFSQEDIEKSQKWSYKFWQQLGTKSPFFRAWFGDWRAYDISPAKIVGFAYGEKSTINYSSRAIRSNELNADIIVDDTVINDSLHYAKKNGDEKQISKFLSKIDEIVSNGILLDTQISTHSSGNKKGSTQFMHYLYTPISINGAPFIAKLSIEEYDLTGKTRAYNLQRIELSEVSRAQYSQLIEENRGKFAYTSDALSVAQLFDFVKRKDKKFSPKPVDKHLVNEDGTPKKFYHGTNEKFDVFSPDELSSREDSFFFAENREDAKGYGDNVYEVYLTGDKFADYDNQPSEFYQLRDKRKQVEYLKERGYDGWYADWDSDGWGEVSVFSNTQIKSATDNIGTFDKSSNIQYSLAEASDAESLLDRYEMGEISREEYLEAINRKKTETPVDIAKLKPEDANTTPDIDEPKMKGEGDGESKIYGSMLESKIINDEVKEQIANNTFIKNYGTTTNKRTLGLAAKKLEEGGANEVERWKGLRPEFASAVDVAEGLILLQHYQNAGNTNGAVFVAEKLHEIGTLSGQVVQIFSIIGRFNPDMMVAYAQRELDKAYEVMVEGKTAKWIENNKSRFKLTDEEINTIRNNTLLASKLEDGSRTKAILLGEIVALIQDKVPPQKGQGMRAWMRISLLLNFKTFDRNLLGNGSMVPIYISSDLFGGLADKAISSAFKTETRTTGFNAKIFAESITKGVKKGTFETLDDFKRHIKTKQDELNRFETNKGSGKSFDEQHTGKFAKQLNSIAKFLNTMDRVTSLTLELGDRPFYEMWFMNSLNNQMRLNNTDIPTQAMLEIAKEEALQRTWQDSNAVSRSLTKIKNALNALNIHGYGLGDVMLKFVKTPANIGKAMVEMSPVGFVFATSKLIQMKNALKKGKFTPQMQKEAVRSISNAVTGTLIYLLIAALASMGAIEISGGGDDDRDVSNFEKYIVGIPPYSIKVFGQNVTYTWNQPFGTIMAIVADIIENNNEGKNLPWYEDAIGAFKTAGTVFTEQSFLSNIYEFFAADDFISGIVELAMSEPSAMIPTAFSQIASFIDPYRRNSYESGHPIKTAINDLLYRIPLLRQSLPTQVNSMGENVENVQYLNPWTAFVAPGNVYPNGASEVAMEIYDIYKETNDKTVMPRVAPNKVTIKGKNISFTAEEKAKFQESMGKSSVDILEKVFASSDYKKLSNEKKAKVVSKVYEYAFAKAKTELDVFDYDLLSAMQGTKSNGEPVLSEDLYNRMDDKAKQMLVDEYFFTKEELKCKGDIDRLVKLFIGKVK